MIGVDWRIYEWLKFSFAASFELTILQIHADVHSKHCTWHVDYRWLFTQLDSNDSSDDTKL